MQNYPRNSALLPAISGCASWAEIHAKWASFTEKEKGDRFEDLTQVFLQLSPLYRSQLKSVWRLEEVPPAVRQKLKLPATDKGIDLVAETHKGEFWAIQCKYRQNTDQQLTHTDISTFTSLTFQACKGFSFALVCSTTERVTSLYRDEQRIGFCALDTWQELDTEFFDQLRAKLTNKPAVLKPCSPRPHQENAIRDGLEHFAKGKAARGKLIMPCGTGKSLTAWFLAQAFSSKRIVIAVPSLSLVKQTLKVWSRESAANDIDVDWICVCSDETAGKADQDDVVVQRQDIAVPCYTSTDKIAEWLRTKHKGLTVVFTTYQSGDVLATAARKAKFTFDLGIMDEAHKTVGDSDKQFSILLHDHNIEIRQRIFMTATERRYKGSSDKVLSMDNVEIYGDTFHQLSFKQAMECQPPILCDYNVITIGVSRQEIKDLIKQNVFVRPTGGKWDEEMEADMLAAMVALRKAMKEHPIKHAVSFHGSIQRAELFKAHNDTFTQEFPEFGSLDTFHVSGQTPTGTRSNIIKAFAQADRSLVTNARCLTEGVDVPGIDCVLFADPRKSTVDIVQAVGRALRPSEGKKLGYVILPVLHETDATSEQVIDSGAFKEILTTISALASNDDRIIEYFRGISQGRNPSGSSRVSFEWDERLAQNIDVSKLVQELEIKCWGRLAKLSWRPFEEAREFVQTLGLKSRTEWNDYCENRTDHSMRLPADVPKAPDQLYRKKGWKSWGDFLGSGVTATYYREYRPFEAAKDFVRSLKIRSVTEWYKYTKGQLPGKVSFPADIPTNPDRGYKDSGWNGFGDWLGTGSLATFEREYLPYEEARNFVVKLGIKSSKEWSNYCKGLLPELGHLPNNIPKTPSVVYKDTGWVGLGEWLGTGTIAPFNKVYRTFIEARNFTRDLKLGSLEEWQSYCSGAYAEKPQLPDDIPKVPSSTYGDAGWLGWADWLGTRPGSLGRGNHMPFEEAREYVRSRNFKGQSDFLDACKNRKDGADSMPYAIPTNPNTAYKNKGWISWGDWLGTGTISTYTRQYRRFEDARVFARSLGLSSNTEWNSYVKGEMKGKPPLPKDIPAVPRNVYKGKGWIDSGDWLGTGNVAPKDREYREFSKARDFARALRLTTQKEWEAYCRGELTDRPPLPPDIPSTPRWIYKDSGWISAGDWLGTGKVADQHRQYIPISEAKIFVRSLGLKSQKEWVAYTHGEIPSLPTLPANIPANPQSTYSDAGWKGMPDWIGAGRTLLKDRSLMQFQEAKKYVQDQHFGKQSDWYLFVSSGSFPSFLPRDPSKYYEKSGWESWGDWLGTGSIASINRSFLPFPEARAYARGLKLTSVGDWRKYSKGAKSGHETIPDYIPKNPDQKYKDSGWISWSDWLGNGNNRDFLPFEDARRFARSLRLKSVVEWTRYAKTGQKPLDIPACPNTAYEGDGWTSFGDWLGVEIIADQQKVFLDYESAKKFVHTLKLRGQTDWFDYCKGKLPQLPPKPINIPTGAPKSYRGKGWSNWGDWLGTGATASYLIEFIPYQKALIFIHSLKLKKHSEWLAYIRGKMPHLPPLPHNIPKSPDRGKYVGSGWTSWGDWLGTGNKRGGQKK